MAYEGSASGLCTVRGSGIENLMRRQFEGPPTVLDPHDTRHAPEGQEAGQPDEVRHRERRIVAVSAPNITEVTALEVRKGSRHNQVSSRSGS